MSTEKLRFDLTRKGVTIDGILFGFPIEITQIESVLGTSGIHKSENPEVNDIFTWDDLGVYAYSKDSKTTDCVAFLFKRTFDADFLPKQTFSQTLSIDGKPYETYVETIQHTLDPWPLTRENKVGKLLLYCAIDDDRNVADIQFCQPTQKVKKVNDKYEQQNISGKKITFSDINFKLAVIQVLMYEKELLQPKFDLDEFVALYSKREIDLEKEGYNFIPEVTNYFEKLEIEEKFAPEITEIFQDGGDDIYLNLICFWDGEDDVFNITSAKDAIIFPNLKKVTMFGNPSTQLIDDFEKIGIVAD